jgi:hypothetical protein
MAWTAWTVWILWILWILWLIVDPQPYPFTRSFTGAMSSSAAGVVCNAPVLALYTHCFNEHGHAIWWSLLTSEGPPRPAGLIKQQAETGGVCVAYGLKLKSYNSYSVHRVHIQYTASNTFVFIHL